MSDTTDYTTNRTITSEEQIPWLYHQLRNASTHYGYTGVTAAFTVLYFFSLNVHIVPSPIDVEIINTYLTPIMSIVAAGFVSIAVVFTFMDAVQDISIYDPDADTVFEKNNQFYTTLLHLYVNSIPVFAMMMIIQLVSPIPL